MTTAEGVQLVLALGTFLMALLTGWMAYHTKRLAQASVAALIENHLPDLENQIADQERMYSSAATNFHIDKIRQGLDPKEFLSHATELETVVFKNCYFPESRQMRDVAVGFKRALGENRLDDAQALVPNLAVALEKLKCSRDKLKKQVEKALT